MKSGATKSFAILTDTTLCTGCENCVRACKKKNNLGQDEPRRWKMAIDDLSATRFTTIIRHDGGHYIRKQCRHCAEPACASACLVGALKKTKEGPVTYDPGLCIGCRYCMIACPYDIPRYEWSKAAPTIRKCDMCYDRVLKGLTPACVEACPESATIFGERSELIAEAKRRLAADPNKYVQKVVGEIEVGGTSVLYISDIPLDFLGWRSEKGEIPLPLLTWASLKKIPPTILGVGAVMSGLYWIIGRRIRLQAEAAQAAANAQHENATMEHLPKENQAKTDNNVPEEKKNIK
jgi:formate dehydrogenase iron-sulfur subunit